MSRCLDAGWRSPKPRCTCGAGDDAPGTAHYSVRFPYSALRTEFTQAEIITYQRRVAMGTVTDADRFWPLRESNEDCPVYLWGRGCDVADQHPTSYQCPIKSCGKTFTYCRAHGGRARAEQECQDHIDLERVAAAVCAADPLP